MKEFIELIISQIIKDPNDITVEEIVDGTKVNININVPEKDMGLMIGKGGRTIRSIRSLATAKAIKDGVKVYVELCEPSK